MANVLLPPDLQEIINDFEQNENHGRKLVSNLSAAQLNRQPGEGKSWSILQCIEHLSLTNLGYIQVMKPMMETADPLKFPRREPLQTGLIGRWFLYILEPPVRMKAPAPNAIVPAPRLESADVLRQWTETHHDLRSILNAGATLDLNALKFRNPFFKPAVMRFGTALRSMSAHERRHIWQAGLIRSRVEAES